VVTVNETAPVLVFGPVLRYVGEPVTGDRDHAVLATSLPLLPPRAHFGTGARRQVMLMGASNTTMTRGPGIFIATCFGIGAIGLFIGGMWEYRGGELFGGTFGVGYAGFLFSTALILKFFAGPIIAAAGVASFAYLGAAIVLNGSMGKEHLPLFPTKLGKA
jgi:GPR1/FUN34/yaaH family